MNEASKAEIIRRQNDQFRSSCGIPVFGPTIDGRIVMTSGIRSLGPEEIIEIWAKVRSFDLFTTDNDPHKEHDFGAFEHAGKKVFWKIDCYDKAYRFGSEDPSDLEQTRRVLTIMLASEY